MRGRYVTKDWGSSYKSRSVYNPIDKFKDTDGTEYERLNGRSDINNYDAYGRIISQELDGVTKVSFNYQNNIEHPSVAHLYSVSDGYIEKTFYFYTDEANYINRYTLGIFTTIKTR